MKPKLIVHGGAGGRIKSQRGADTVRQVLQTIVREVYELLANDSTATEAVIYGCQLLENHPTFNAGTGSVLQSDGQIRMSAAIMDGSRQRFSGIINGSRIQHPIKLASFLQSESDRVISGPGIQELARELQIPLYDPLVEARLQEWIQERRNNFDKSMAEVVADPSTLHESQRGTIGVVALDHQGQVAAGTSTGGKGLERIGRVSDSAMPAGTYANQMAGVSCTGIGEDIIDECLAAKIVIRVTDGMTLNQAMQKSLIESQQHQRDLGAIAISSNGMICWGKTSEMLLAAYHDGQNIKDTIDWDEAKLVGST